MARTKAVEYLERARQLEHHARVYAEAGNTHSAIIAKQQAEAYQREAYRQTNWPQKVQS